MEKAELIPRPSSFEVISAFSTKNVPDVLGDSPPNRTWELNVHNWVESGLFTRTQERHEIFSRIVNMSFPQ